MTKPIAVGMAIGAGIGVLLGGKWIALGAGIGLVIGGVFKPKHDSDGEE